MLANFDKKNNLLYRTPIKISLIGILGTGICCRYSYPRISLIFLGIHWGGLVYDSIKEATTPLGIYLNKIL